MSTALKSNRPSKTASAAPVVAKADAPKLAEVRLHREQARKMAKQLEAAGRAAEAQSLLAMVESRRRITISMPIEQTMKVAMTLHREGAPRDAEAHYRAVLSVEPEHPRAHHFLGVLLHNTHRTEKAMPHLMKSLETLSDQAWAWSNLGVVYRERRDLEKAEEIYRKALSLKEDYPEAHNNLGIVYRWMKRWEDARRHYLRSIELKPDYVEAFVNLGKLQFGLKEYDAAMESFSRGILLYPGSAAQSRHMLARAHLTLGQTDKAIEVYHDWIKEEPDNPTPRHLLSACVGEAPARAADNYVAKSFDAFANSFDAKLAHLGYRAPQLVAAALATAHDESQSYGIVADAGCGTGLCGPLIRKRTKKLIGVDLSSGMLAKAKERGGYDVLREAELTAFLEEKKNAYNTVISADTLCYFGVLTEFAKAAIDSLKSNGVLVFTVEALPDDSAEPYVLQVHGRYAHRRSYVEEALCGAGFAVEAMRHDVLRTEDGKAVHGWLVTARKPA